MANEKKPEGRKNAPKVETVNLKVYIHCDGCKKKVRKTLINVEGVHSVEVDGSLGKVTVTGTVDSKILIKKLEKAGKVVELFPSGGNKGKDQSKGNNKEKNEERNGANEDAEKKDNHETKGNSAGNGGESGKKKKGGGANPLDESTSIANKSITPYGIQTGYISMGSAEYATHMFSDENANNCTIM